MKPSEMLAKRIAWARENPTALAWPGAPISRWQYVEGFARSTGSYVEGVDTLDAVDRLFASLDAIFDDDCLQSEKDKEGNRGYQEGNDYYIVSVPGDYKAFSAAISVKALRQMDPALLDTVRLSIARHGVELQSAAIPPQPTTVITLIVDGDGLVTWFPGVVLPPINMDDAPVKLAR